LRMTMLNLNSILIVVLLLPLGSVDLANAEELFEETCIFAGGQDDINTYRIPSLACTRRGTVLAFCEGRKDSNGDGTPTHLVMKRSLGNTGTWNPPHQSGLVPEGRSRERNMTWLPMQIILPCKRKEAYMNPVPIIDQSDEAIYLLVNYHALYDPKRDEFGGDTHIWLLKSRDEGATWSKPTDLTPQVGARELGPGAGIQTSRGTLVAPVYDGVIYSEDHGKTWQGGSKTPGPVNESQVVELADGSLMLNTRGAPVRTVIISKDGGRSWGEPHPVPSLSDPELYGGCQASLIRYPNLNIKGSQNLLLFANPADLKYRMNLTVRVSFDEGMTWPVSKLIRKGSGAYSCLTIFPDGTIGIIYETGNTYSGIIESYAMLAFARFNLEWLTGGRNQ
ncbi:MAG TPA: sialidase family protein, partial [Terriglobia bacterium]|nr:sialidase family protein [Terriglobia bacterium]